MLKNFLVSESLYIAILGFSLSFSLRVFQDPNKGFSFFYDRAKLHFFRRPKVNEGKNSDQFLFTSSHVVNASLGQK